jgi:hypothetical protein
MRLSRCGSLAGIDATNWSRRCSAVRMIGWRVVRSVTVAHLRRMS